MRISLVNSLPALVTQLVLRYRSLRICVSISRLVYHVVPPIYAEFTETDLLSFYFYRIKYPPPHGVLTPQLDPKQQAERVVFKTVKW